MLIVFCQSINIIIEVKFLFAFHIVVVLIRDVLIIVVSSEINAKGITLFLFRIFVIYIGWINEILMETNEHVVRQEYNEK